MRLPIDIYLQILKEDFIITAMSTYEKLIVSSFILFRKNLMKLDANDLYLLRRNF